MKLPNFRLYDTQATTSFYLGILGILALVFTLLVVAWGFDYREMVIPYNTEHFRGKARPFIVLGAAGATFGVGLVAGILGFRSLGQKRNSRQTHSWVGMLAGAFVMSLAPVLYLTWRTFSEALITGK